jgi:hypothetical protein
VLLLSAVIGFAVLAIESIMRGDDTPTKEDAEMEALSATGMSGVTLDSAERAQAGLEIVVVGQSPSVPLIANGSIQVPETAIQRLDGNSMVFVADTLPNRYLPRFVHVDSPMGDGKVEITAGLLPGDQLVIKGARLLGTKLDASHVGPFHTSK